MSSRPVSGVPQKDQEAGAKNEDIAEKIDINEIDERFENYFKNLNTKQYDILKPIGSQGNLGSHANLPKIDDIDEKIEEEDPMRKTSTLNGLDLELSQNTRGLEKVTS